MIHSSSAFKDRSPSPLRRPSAAGTAAAASSGASSSGAKPAPDPASPSSSSPHKASHGGMRPHEGQLSGYLMARAAMGRKIDDAAESRKLPDGKTLKSENVLADLRAANDTLEQARALLPHGRGNVKSDILATQGGASRRHEAGARLEEHYLRKKGLNNGEDPLFELGMKTAISHFTGQASCGGSALVTAHLHAPKLGKDQAAIVVHNRDVDHMWTEAVRRNTDPNNDQIIDRWTAGPAVLRQDSSYGTDRNFYDFFTLNADNRDASLANVGKITREMKADGALNARFLADMIDLKKARFRFKGKVWNEEIVLSEGFRRHAGKILHPNSSKVPNSDKILERDKKAPVLPFAKDVLAAGVARSLGESVQGAVDRAPWIREAAKHMFPRPPSRRAGPSQP